MKNLIAYGLTFKTTINISCLRYISLINLICLPVFNKNEFFFLGVKTMVFNYWGEIRKGISIFNAPIRYYNSRFKLFVLINFLFYFITFFFWSLPSIYEICGFSVRSIFYLTK